MKKQKVICDHYHLCTKVKSTREILFCEHEKPHEYDEDCDKSQCDFLLTDLNNHEHVHCNMKQFRKEKLKKLICDHSHTCLNIQSTLRCPHEKHHHHNKLLCITTKCDFLSKQLKKDVISSCINIKDIRKDKLNKLNEASESNMHSLSSL